MVCHPGCNGIVAKVLESASRVIRKCECVGTNQGCRDRRWVKVCCRNVTVSNYERVALRLREDDVECCKSYKDAVTLQPGNRPPALGLKSLGGRRRHSQPRRQTRQPANILRNAPRIASSSACAINIATITISSSNVHAGRMTTSDHLSETSLRFPHSSPSVTNTAQVLLRRAAANRSWDMQHDDHCTSYRFDPLSQ